MFPYPPNQNSPSLHPTSDVDALQQQNATLIEINRRLIGEGVMLRQQLDALINQSAEQTIAQLKQAVDGLKQSNAALIRQIERQQDEHAQAVARLTEEVRSLQGLVAHQHSRMKEVFGAGLAGTPQAKD